MKFLKVGRVAIITRGRYAGKKVRLMPKELNPREVEVGSDGLETEEGENNVKKENTTRIAIYLRSTPIKQFSKNATSSHARRDTTIYTRREQRAKFADRRFSLIQVVIIQPIDSGNKSHPYGHAIVAGIERYPSKITRRMSKTRQEKRSKIKPFIKVINYNHLMPTRYTLELEGLKGSVTNDTFKEVTQREDAKKNVKKVLEERYTSGKNRWFFTPLKKTCHDHTTMFFTIRDSL
ncbi:hypothetical protein G7054_g13418 [Neopestalotiopsis clavispora]|nr:hypothetical protein G7054_g13418 [Neopestalotiopsis clavispora]